MKIFKRLKKFANAVILAMATSASLLATESFADSPSSPAVAQPRLDIVSTAVAAGQFKILVRLLNETGLVDVLRSEGPFTVFAPTDEAFISIFGESAAEELAKDKLAATRVLLKHVVKGKFDSSLLVDPKNEYVFLIPVLAEEFPDQTLGFSVSRNAYPFPLNSLVINGGSQVLLPDVFATNGVVHVISNVLL